MNLDYTYQELEDFLKRYTAHSMVLLLEEGHRFRVYSYVYRDRGAFYWTTNEQWKYEHSAKAWRAWMVSGGFGMTFERFLDKWRHEK